MIISCENSRNSRAPSDRSLPSNSWSGTRHTDSHNSNSLFSIIGWAVMLLTPTFKNSSDDLSLAGSCGLTHIDGVRAQIRSQFVNNIHIISQINPHTATQSYNTKSITHHTTHTITQLKTVTPPAATPPAATPPAATQREQFTWAAGTV